MDADLVGGGLGGLDVNLRSEGISRCFDEGVGLFAKVMVVAFVLRMLVDAL